jgi:hypothetical protein
MTESGVAELSRDLALKSKAEGNRLFGIGDIHGAISHYVLAQEQCPDECASDRAMIHSNLAACHILHSEVY